MTKIGKAAMALGVVAALGVAALPLSTYAAVEADIPVSVQVPQATVITDPDDPTTTGEVSPNALDFVFDGTTIGSTLTLPLHISGTTTAAAGFSVSMSTTGAQTALVKTDDGTQMIPTGGGAATLATNTWGYRDGGNYIPVQPLATPATVFATADAGAANKTLTFGVNVDATKPAGTYTNTLRITIAHNS